MNIQEACYLLGVTGTASPSEIKAAYRKASTRAHPDRGGSDEQMSLVNLARDILTGKAPSSTDDKPHGVKPEREPCSKEIEISLSYEEWCAGAVKKIQDAEVNRILDKIINYSFDLEISAYHNLDESIKLDNGDSYVEFVPVIDTGVFKRRGMDLIAVHSIELYDYLYNRFFYVNHPLQKNRIKVLIPEDRVFIGGKRKVIVVKEKGFCSPSKKGNMLIALNVELPDFENISDKAKLLLKPALAEIKLQ